MDENRSMQVTVSSLDKVFPQDGPSLFQSNFKVMKNEIFHFQVACKAQRLTQMLRAEVISDLGDRVSIRTVESVPARFALNPASDDYYIKGHGNDEMYPDLLRPVYQGGEIFVPESWFTFWVTVDGTKDPLPVGEHLIKVRIYNTYDETLWFKYDETSIFELTVLDDILPKHDITYTRWMHYDCICDKHNVEPWTDEFYKITAEYVDSAVRHGMNMLYTPLITPSLDTKIGTYRRTIQLVGVEKVGKDQYKFDLSELKRFMEFAAEHGIEYYELSHLATQWGARFTPKVEALVNGKMERIFGWDQPINCPEFDAFLNQMLAALRVFFVENGYMDKIYFHISDEPRPGVLENFKVVWSIVRKHFPEARFMDALTHREYHDEGYITHPVVGLEVYDEFPTEWVYYCGCMCKDYVTNCHFTMPLQRNRILGYQLYRNGSTGFLQWAVNYYHATDSRYKIDPYFVTDGGGAFEAGDAFVVYPAEGTVYESMRHEVLFDAFQDYSSLKLLESYIGKEAVLALLDDYGVKIGYYTYPHSAEWHLNFKLKIYELIEQAKAAKK